MTEKTITVNDYNTYAKFINDAIYKFASPMYKYDKDFENNIKKELQIFWDNISKETKNQKPASFTSQINSNYADILKENFAKLTELCNNKTNENKENTKEIIYRLYVLLYTAQTSLDNLQIKNSRRKNDKNTKWKVDLTNFVKAAVSFFTTQKLEPPFHINNSKEYFLIPYDRKPEVIKKLTAEFVAKKESIEVALQNAISQNHEAKKYWLVKEQLKTLCTSIQDLQKNKGKDFLIDLQYHKKALRNSLTELAKYCTAAYEETDETTELLLICQEIKNWANTSYKDAQIESTDLAQLYPHIQAPEFIQFLYFSLTLIEKLAAAKKEDEALINECLLLKNALTNLAIMTNTHIASLKEKETQKEEDKQKNQTGNQSTNVDNSETPVVINPTEIKSNSSASTINYTTFINPWHEAIAACDNIRLKLEKSEQPSFKSNLQESTLSTLLNEVNFIYNQIANISVVENDNCTRDRLIDIFDKQREILEKLKLIDQKLKSTNSQNLTKKDWGQLRSISDQYPQSFQGFLGQIKGRRSHIDEALTGKTPVNHTASTVAKPTNNSAINNSTTSTTSSYPNPRSEKKSSNGNLNNNNYGKIPAISTTPTEAKGNWLSAVPNVPPNETQYAAPVLPAGTNSTTNDKSSPKNPTFQEEDYNRFLNNHIIRKYILFASDMEAKLEKFEKKLSTTISKDHVAATKQHMLSDYSYLERQITFWVYSELQSSYEKYGTEFSKATNIALAQNLYKKVQFKLTQLRENDDLFMAISREEDKFFEPDLLDLLTDSTENRVSLIKALCEAGERIKAKLKTVTEQFDHFKIQHFDIFVSDHLQYFYNTLAKKDYLYKLEPDVAKQILKFYKINLKPYHEAIIDRYKNITPTNYSNDVYPFTIAEIFEKQLFILDIVAGLNAENFQPNLIEAIDELDSWQRAVRGYNQKLAASDNKPEQEQILKDLYKLYLAFINEPLTNYVALISSHQTILQKFTADLTQIYSELKKILEKENLILTLEPEPEPTPSAIITKELALIEAAHYAKRMYWKNAQIAEEVLNNFANKKTIVGNLERTDEEIHLLLYYFQALEQIKNHNYLTYIWAGQDIHLFNNNSNFLKELQIQIDFAYKNFLIIINAFERSKEKDDPKFFETLINAIKQRYPLKSDIYILLLQQYLNALKEGVTVDKNYALKIIIPICKSNIPQNEDMTSYKTTNSSFAGSHWIFSQIIFNFPKDWKINRSFLKQPTINLWDPINLPIPDYPIENLKSYFNEAVISTIELPLQSDTTSCGDYVINAARISMKNFVREDQTSAKITQELIDSLKQEKNDSKAKFEEHNQLLIEIACTINDLDLNVVPDKIVQQPNPINNKTTPQSSGIATSIVSSLTGDIATINTGNAQPTNSSETIIVVSGQAFDQIPTTGNNTPQSSDTPSGSSSVINTPNSIITNTGNTQSDDTINLILNQLNDPSISIPQIVLTTPATQSQSTPASSTHSTITDNQPKIVNAPNPLIVPTTQTVPNSASVTNNVVPQVSTSPSPVDNRKIINDSVNLNHLIITTEIERHLNGKDKLLNDIHAALLTNNSSDPKQIALRLGIAAGFGIVFGLVGHVIGGALAAHISQQLIQQSINNFNNQNGGFPSSIFNYLVESVIPKITDGTFGIAGAAIGISAARPLAQETAAHLSSKLKKQDFESAKQYINSQLFLINKEVDWKYARAANEQKNLVEKFIEEYAQTTVAGGNAEIIAKAIRGIAEGCPGPLRAYISAKEAYITETHGIVIAGNLEYAIQLINNVNNYDNFNYGQDLLCRLTDIHAFAETNKAMREIAEEKTKADGSTSAKSSKANNEKLQRAVAVDNQTSARLTAAALFGYARKYHKKTTISTDDYLKILQNIYETDKEAFFRITRYLITLSADQNLHLNSSIDPEQVKEFNFLGLHALTEILENDLQLKNSTQEERKRIHDLRQRQQSILLENYKFSKATDVTPSVSVAETSNRIVNQIIKKHTTPVRIDWGNVRSKIIDYGYYVADSLCHKFAYDEESYNNKNIPRKMANLERNKEARKALRAHLVGLDEACYESSEGKIYPISLEIYTNFIQQKEFLNEGDRARAERFIREYKEYSIGRLYFADEGQSKIINVSTTDPTKEALEQIYVRTINRLKPALPKLLQEADDTAEDDLDKSLTKVDKDINDSIVNSLADRLKYILLAKFKETNDINKINQLVMTWLKSTANISVDYKQKNKQDRELIGDSILSAYHNFIKYHQQKINALQEGEKKNYIIDEKTLVENYQHLLNNIYTTFNQSPDTSLIKHQFKIEDKTKKSHRYVTSLIEELIKAPDNKQKLLELGNILRKILMNNNDYKPIEKIVGKTINEILPSGAEQTISYFTLFWRAIYNHPFKDIDKKSVHKNLLILLANSTGLAQHFYHYAIENFDKDEFKYIKEVWPLANIEDMPILPIKNLERHAKKIPNIIKYTQELKNLIDPNHSHSAIERLTNFFKPKISTNRLLGLINPQKITLIEICQKLTWLYDRIKRYNTPDNPNSFSMYIKQIFDSIDEGHKRNEAGVVILEALLTNDKIIAKYSNGENTSTITEGKILDKIIDSLKDDKQKRIPDVIVSKLQDHLTNDSPAFQLFCKIIGLDWQPTADYQESDGLLKKTQ